MLKKVLRLFFKLRGFFRSPHKKVSDKWFADRGDETLRLDYDLNKNSIVFDVGGYMGDWASDIFSKYGCRIYVFEPVQEFAEKIRRRFSKNKRIMVFDFGLAEKTSKKIIYVDDDQSSVFRRTGRKENIPLKNIIDFIKEKGIKKIDLMKINIEGGEYGLLEHLIQERFIKNIKNIQIQFHRIGKNYGKRAGDIQKKLKETHHLTYRYHFVWENWKLNK